jgi:hypothetical protein
MFSADPPLSVLPLFRCLGIKFPALFLSVFLVAASQKDAPEFCWYYTPRVQVHLLFFIVFEVVYIFFSHHGK